MLFTGDPHLYLTLWRLRQEEHHKFEARLGHRGLFLIVLGAEKSKLQVVDSGGQ